jgi:hypothetical protein
VTRQPCQCELNSTGSKNEIENKNEFFFDAEKSNTQMGKNIQSSQIAKKLK